MESYTAKIRIRDPKINSLFKNSEDSNIHSKSALFVVLYKFLHVCFGLDLGFFDSSDKKNIIKYLTLFFVTAASVTNIICSYLFTPISVFLYITYYTLQHVVFILILFTTKYTMCNYYHAIIEIDAKLNSKSETIFQNRFIILIIMIIVYKIVLGTAWSFVYNEYIAILWYMMTYYFMWICHDFVSASNSLVFSLTCNQLKSLSNQLESATTGFNSFNIVYKYIVDAAESIKISFDSIVSSLET